MRVLITEVRIDGDAVWVRARPDHAAVELNAAWDGHIPEVGATHHVELDVSGGVWGEDIGLRPDMEGDDVMTAEIEATYPDEALAVVRLFGGLVQIDVDGLPDLAQGVAVGVRARDIRLSDIGL